MAVETLSSIMPIPTTYNPEETLSELLIVDMGVSPYNQFKQGGATVDIKTLVPYKVEIDLAMEKSVDSRGLIRWLDDGKRYDNYRTSIEVEGVTASALENLLTSDSTDTLYITTPIVNGFYPFGMNFSTEQDYAVHVTKKYKGKDVNIFGKLRMYELEIIPAVEDIYSSYTKSGIIADCGRSLNHWQIDTTYFPFGDFKDDVNDWKRVVQLGGNSSEMVDTTRDYGDICTVKVNCSEEQARKIISFLTETMRGVDKTATFPSIYNMFGRRYPDLTSAIVRIADTRITIEHVKAANVNIEFKLQMVSES